MQEKIVSQLAVAAGLVGDESIPYYDPHEPGTPNRLKRMTTTLLRAFVLSGALTASGYAADGSDFKGYAKSGWGLAEWTTMVQKPGPFADDLTIVADGNNATFQVRSGARNGVDVNTLGGNFRWKFNGSAVESGYIEHMRIGHRAAYMMYSYDGAGGFTENAYGAIDAYTARGYEGVNATGSLAGDVLFKLQARGRARNTLDWWARGGAAVTMYATEDWDYATDSYGADLRFETTLNGTRVKREVGRFSHQGYLGVGVVAPTRTLHVAGGVLLDAPQGESIQLRFLTGFFSIGRPITWTMEPTTNQIVHEADGGLATVAMNSYLDAFAGSAPGFTVSTSRGTKAATLAVLANDPLFALYARSMHADGGVFSGLAGGKFSLKASENHTATARGNFWAFETTGIGTTARREVARIDDAGNVELKLAGKGVYFRSPNNTRYLLTLNDAGAVVVTAAP